MNLKLSMRFALRTALGLILYFLLMKTFGLENNHELRLLNFIFIVIGIFGLHRRMFLRGEKHSYLDGLFSGLRMGVIAIVLFMVFMGLYAAVADQEFVQIAKESNIWGGNLDIYQIAVAIMMEGLASCMIISYISMQYFKNRATDTHDWPAESAPPGEGK